MKPFAVDANAIHAFQQERISSSPGIAHEAISFIMTRDCVALDSEKLCLQEWLECAGGAFPFALSDWIVDQIAIGRVRFFPLSPNTCRKHLLSLGLPADDHKWVRLAIGSGGNSIITDDVDFFDPTKKAASAKVKAKVKAAGRGPCSKALGRTYGVSVMGLASVQAAITPPPPPASPATP